MFLFLLLLHVYFSPLDYKLVKRPGLGPSFLYFFYQIILNTCSSSLMAGIFVCFVQLSPQHPEYDLQYSRYSVHMYQGSPSLDRLCLSPQQKFCKERHDFSFAFWVLHVAQRNSPFLPPTQKVPFHLAQSLALHCLHRPRIISNREAEAKWSSPRKIEISRKKRARFNLNYIICCCKVGANFLQKKKSGKWQVYGLRKIIPTGASLHQRLPLPALPAVEQGQKTKACRPHWTVPCTWAF